MTVVAETQIMSLFVLFCRIGGCVLLAPGLSSPRVPVHVRLFVGLGVTAAVAPLLIGAIASRLQGVSDHVVTGLIINETVVGATIGLMARCFFLALQFAATAASSFIGLSGIPGLPLEEGDTGSPLATLVSSAAVSLVFASGLHIELLRAVVDSYSVMPLGAGLSSPALIGNFMRVVGETWLLALRLCGPFLLYGVTVNFALGLGNRFAQQISVYHATTGAVMLGGFLLLYVVWADWSVLFLESYRSWLLAGGF